MRRATKRTAAVQVPGALALAALLAGCSAAPRRPAPAPAPAPETALFVEPAADPAGGSLADLLPPQQGRDSIPPPMDTRMSYERGPSEAFNWGHVTFDAEWIPATWVTVDLDNGVASDIGDLDTGSGFLLRGGFGSNQQNIGVLYMATWHDEETTGRGASTQQLLLDFLYRAPIPEMNGLVWFEVDGGIGGVNVEFDSDSIDDEVTGSALLHGDLEFMFGRRFTVAVGGGGFVWGHFGDTLAYGTYVTIGAKLLF